MCVDSTGLRRSLCMCWIDNWNSQYLCSECLSNAYLCVDSRVWIMNWSQVFDEHFDVLLLMFVTDHYLHFLILVLDPSTWWFFISWFEPLNLPVVEQESSGILARRLGILLRQKGRSGFLILCSFWKKRRRRRSLLWRLVALRSEERYTLAPTIGGFHWTQCLKRRLLLSMTSTALAVLIEQ